jgi:hypothetical protein
MITRRTFLKYTAGGTMLTLFGFDRRAGLRRAIAQIPGGSLAPAAIPNIQPAGLPTTTVWGYGAVTSASQRGLLLHNAPSLTIEAGWRRPVRVKWINELIDTNGDYLPHLLPVDQTLHWANPPGGTEARDMRPFSARRPPATSARSRSSHMCTPHPFQLRENRYLV